MRIRIQQLKLMRIHADPDPQPFLLVVDGVPDVNVGGVGHLPARRVQVHHIGLACFASVQLSGEPLDKGGLAGAGHAKDNDARGQVFLFTAVCGRLRHLFCTVAAGRYR